jgi:hypothetical protein
VPFWLSVTKAVLPYTKDILYFLVPMSNASKEDKQENQVEGLKQQVAELQEDSLKNSREIGIIAEKLETILILINQKKEADLRLGHAHLLYKLIISIISLTIAGSIFINLY